jgi:hypothetical protein
MSCVQHRQSLRGSHGRIVWNTPSGQAPHELPRLFSRPDRVHAPLYVVCPVINAARFRTRWKHYEDFAKHAAEAGAILYTVEVAFGDRDFVVTQRGNPRHVQLRTQHELWLKERAINIAVSRLPEEWRYVAWVDPDCLFTRHDWADETVQTLQHYPVAQMWSQLVDVDSNFEVVAHLRSFMSVQTHGPTPAKCDYASAMKSRIGLGQKFGSPGLAWAARREAWNELGGIIDSSILGAGDWYFAHAIMGTMAKALEKRNDLTAPFVKKLLQYQEHVKRAKWSGRSIAGNVGLVKGTAVHYWHGPRNNRGYGTRGEILTRHGFDPERDLLVDWQGLYQLTDRRPGLRREIQEYFKQRNEDAPSA